MLRLKETLNPASFECAPKAARFYIIKSFSEDDVHKSIKYGVWLSTLTLTLTLTPTLALRYGVWASTDSGNRRLDQAYREAAHKGPIYLFFSVNASGQFAGMAQMESALDYTKKFGAWGQDKWNGTFTIKWTWVKDVPNSHLRGITLPNNGGKPVTNSRDTQEVPLEVGRELLRVFHRCAP